MGLGLGISVDWASLVPYYAKVASAFAARVKADGGTVENTACLKKDLKVLSPTPPPAFTGLLNTYSGAAAAYSLRLLDNTYSGNAIKVRRSSDNAEQDIAFVNNELDTASLETFAGSGDAFVTTWYDQSGNGVNATQTSASSQPKIVSSGSTILENGKPCVSYGGNDNLLVWNNTTAPTLFQDMSDAISVLLVEKATAISNSGSYWINGNTTMELRVNRSGGDSLTKVPYSIGYESSKFAFGVSSAGTADSEQKLSGAITSAQRLSISFVNGDDLDVYLNSSSAISTTFATATGDRSVGTTDSTFAIGSRSRDGGQADTSYFSGTMQEIVLYKSNESSNRTGIETNINDFYSIY